MFIIIQVEMVKFSSLVTVLMALFLGVTSADDCVEKFIVTTLTADISSAQSNEWFALVVKYKVSSLQTNELIYTLYDRPGNDMEKGDGDTWYLDWPARCIRPEDITKLEIRPLTSGLDPLFDGWNIETAQTFAKMTNGEIVVLSVDDKVFAWIDFVAVVPNTLVMNLNDVATSHEAKHQCIHSLIVYATTSGDTNAGSDGTFIISVTYNGQTKQKTLYNRPGNDYQRNDGDLWYYNMDEFGFEGCVEFGDIQDVRFVADTNNGWKIGDAYITAALKDSGKYALLAGDYPAEVWVDGNSGTGYYSVPLRNQ